MAKKVLFEVRERSADPAFQVIEDDNGVIQTHYGATYASEADVMVGAKYSTDASGNVTGLVGKGRNEIPINGIACEGFGASPSATAAQNNTAIQAALDVAGVVTLTKPGNYSFSATFISRSNTHFRIADGVNLIRELPAGAGSATRFMHNENYASTVYPVTGNLSGSAIGSGRLAFIYGVDMTVPGHEFTVGSYVLVKGDLNNYYNGVHKVVSVAGDVVTFHLIYNGTLPSSSGAITAALADANITIDVAGYIDGNIINNVDNSTDGLNTMAFVFNKVGNLRVPSLRIGGFNKYAMHMANIYGFESSYAYFKNPSDGFHFNSPARNVVITNVFGETGDDMVAFTANNVGFTQYALPDDTGDFETISISNIQADYAKGSLVAIYPAHGSVFRNVSIRDISAPNGGAAAVTIASAAVDGFYGVVDDVLIDGVSFAQQNGGTNGVVNVYGPVNIGVLTVRSAKDALGPNTAVVAITGNTTSGSTSISSPSSTAGVVIGQSVYGTGIPAGAYVTAIGATITISEAATATGTGVSLKFKTPVAHKGPLLSFGSGGGNIDTLNIADVAWTSDCTSSGYTRRLVNLATGANSRINTTNLFNVVMNALGASASYSIFGQGSDSWLKQVVGTNVTIRGFGNMADGNGNALGTVYSLTNITLNNAQFLIGAVSSAVVMIDGVNITGTLSGPVLNLYGTSKTYNLSVRGARNANTSGQALVGYGTTNTFNILGGDGTFALKSDTAGHTFNFSAGAIVYDTQTAAPGIYAKGPTTYTRISA